MWRVPGVYPNLPNPKGGCWRAKKKKKKHIMSKLENSLSLEFVTFRPELGLWMGLVDQAITQLSCLATGATLLILRGCETQISSNSRLLAHKEWVWKWTNLAKKREDSGRRRTRRLEPAIGSFFLGSSKGDDRGPWLVKRLQVILRQSYQMRISEPKNLPRPDPHLSDWQQTYQFIQ